MPVTLARLELAYREEIAGELESLHHTDLEETREIVLDTSWETEARDPEELAEAINALPGEEYRKLWERCRHEPMRLPFRRTTPWRVRPTKSRDEASDSPDTDAGIPDSLPSGDEAAGGATCAAARHPQAGSREAGTPVPAGFSDSPHVPLGSRDLPGTPVPAGASRETVT